MKSDVPASTEPTGAPTALERQKETLRARRRVSGATRPAGTGWRTESAFPVSSCSCTPSAAAALACTCRAPHARQSQRMQTFALLHGAAPTRRAPSRWILRPCLRHTAPSLFMKESGRTLPPQAVGREAMSMQSAFAFLGVESRAWLAVRTVVRVLHADDLQLAEVRVIWAAPLLHGALLPAER
jgi:hypothetical protein